MRASIAFIFFALAAFGASQTEKDLRSQTEAQAATITAQASTIADLKAQLAAAHIQDAVLSHQAAAANGVAAGSGAEVVDLTSKLAVAQTETEHAKSAASGSTEKVADLQSKLADAHVQTAIAKGVASESKATLKAHREKDSAVLQSGSDASIAAAKLGAEAVRLGKENRAALETIAPKVDKHTEAIEQLRRSDRTISILLVIMCLVLLAQIPIVAAIVIKGRNKQWLTPNLTANS